MAKSPNFLPIIDLSSTDRVSTANSIRQACIDYGFFYLINHGMEEEFLERVFEESKKFFALPVEEKMKVARKEHRGYTPLYDEKLDSLGRSRGDFKEGFYIGPMQGLSQSSLNQWPSEGNSCMPSWKTTMESYYEKVLYVGRRLASLIALALNLEERFFDKVGALHAPMAFLRLLHYPGELSALEEEVYGASAHSDYGMITLLATDGVRGLQACFAASTICREKDKRPHIWEDVYHINGALIVNIGDMMERWTNCLFRSTLHRVMPTGQERYSLAFFMDPNHDCVVQCLESCCSEASPPKFPPVRSGDYLEERIKAAYSSQES
ncbi:hypothetical protein GIB67_015587 [Kingdonia uniflora]|uniref:Fe2OG dioxygenase domain-containing protein n=1 Tax=Kingdonia uniflora TaxID=39325 RepID=A0A7J7LU89_9MAGN|nr:hypothetical protein GIB67_015587 [Kingdonia uniflora]